jgi:hypothetical protein
MAAIDVVQKLRFKNREASNKTSFPADYGWGTLKVLGGVDIGKLARQELRNHLEARDLGTLGNKRQLVERLQKSVLEEQVQLSRCCMLSTCLVSNYAMILHCDTS